MRFSITLLAIGWIDTLGDTYLIFESPAGAW